MENNISYVRSQLEKDIDQFIEKTKSGCYLFSETYSDHQTKVIKILKLLLINKNWSKDDFLSFCFLASWIDYCRKERETKPLIRFRIYLSASKPKNGLAEDIIQVYQKENLLIACFLDPETGNYQENQIVGCSPGIVNLLKFPQKKPQAIEFKLDDPQNQYTNFERKNFYNLVIGACGVTNAARMNKDDYKNVKNRLLANYDRIYSHLPNEMKSPIDWLKYIDEFPSLTYQQCGLFKISNNMRIKEEIQRVISAKKLHDLNQAYCFGFDFLYFVKFKVKNNDIEIVKKYALMSDQMNDRGIFIGISNHPVLTYLNENQNHCFVCNDTTLNLFLKYHIPCEVRELAFTELKIEIPSFRQIALVSIFNMVRYDLINSQHLEDDLEILYKKPLARTCKVDEVLKIIGENDPYSLIDNVRKEGLGIYLRPKELGLSVENGGIVIDNSISWKNIDNLCNLNYRHSYLGLVRLSTIAERKSNAIKLLLEGGALKEPLKIEVQSSLFELCFGEVITLHLKGTQKITINDLLFIKHEIDQFITQNIVQQSVNDKIINNKSKQARDHALKIIIIGIIKDGVTVAKHIWDKLYAMAPQRELIQEVTLWNDKNPTIYWISPNGKERRLGRRSFETLVCRIKKQIEKNCQH